LCAMKVSPQRCLLQSSDCLSLSTHEFIFDWQIWSGCYGGRHQASVGYFSTLFLANIKRSLNVAALILAVGPVRLLYPVMFYDSVQNRSGKLCVCIDHNQ
jgi:hypothetical protein